MRSIPLAMASLVGLTVLGSIGCKPPPSPPAATPPPANAAAPAATSPPSAASQSPATAASAPAASTSATTASAAGVKVQDPEYDQFGQAFAAAAARGDIAAIESLWDFDEMVRRGASGIDVTPSQLASFGAGLKSSLFRPFQTEVPTTVAQKGTYRYVHTRDFQGVRRVLLRLTTSDGGFSYQELTVERRPDGRLRAVDLFVYSVGSLVTTEARQNLLQLFAGNQSLLAKLTGAENEYLKNLPLIGELVRLQQAGAYAQVLSRYSELPPAVQRTKQALMIRLQAAQKIGRPEYMAALADIQKHLPQDSVTDTLMIDAYQYQGKWDQALAAIERLDQAVGGDAFLHFVRAQVFIQQRNVDAARRSQAILDQWDANFGPSHLNHLLLSLAERNFDETVRRLDKLASELGIVIQQMESNPLYAEFIKSPQYAAWKQSQGGKR
jgi:hypothetical protein